METKRLLIFQRMRTQDCENDDRGYAHCQFQLKSGCKMKAKCSRFEFSIYALLAR